MAYPWYSTGKRYVGKNQVFGVTIEDNCETNAIRYRADIIDWKSRSGQKYITSEDLQTLKNKVLTYIEKMEVKIDGQLEDVQEVFERLYQRITAAS